jgi:4-amino-4-deoxy-L-arabinose transferase-like glycosyltransferase
MDSEAPDNTGLRRRDRLILVALLTVALVWRLVYFLEMEASPYAGNLTLDSEIYHQTAVEVTHGRLSGGSTFFQAPLYPWVLGLVYSLFGTSQAIAKLLQILLSVASCWLIYRIADRIFDRTVARVALGISSTYGLYLYFANELLVVTLIVFLDLLGLDLLLRAGDDDRKILWGAAGVVFGFSAIARPTILPFVAVVCVWTVASGWRSGKRRAVLTATAVFAAGVALPITPVTLHNWLADGDLVLIASNGGFNFYIGNNPQSDGITAAAPGIRADRGDAHSEQVQAAREALGNAAATPREMSDYWYSEAWEYIRSTPGEALRRTAYKAFILWNAHEISNNRVIEFVTRHSSIFRWTTIRFWVILPLALAGGVVGGGRRRLASLLLVFAVVYAVTVVPFFITARFRMPVVAVLIIFAAAAVVGWCRWLQARPLDWQRGRRVLASVIVALVAAVVVRPLPALKVPNAQAFFNEAEAYRSQEDYAGAAHWYERALDEYSGYCDAAYNLARIHTDISPDPHRVVEVLEPAIEQCAEDTGIRSLFGRALCAVGRCDEGGEHLRFVQERESTSEVF